MLDFPTADYPKLLIIYQQLRSSTLVDHSHLHLLLIYSYQYDLL